MTPAGQDGAAHAEPDARPGDYPGDEPHGKPDADPGVLLTIAGHPAIAALPMYDWPERRDTVDAAWRDLRNRLVQAGIGAPERLARRNADMPAVPGGIRDPDGAVIAPDPATLDPEGFDLDTLWRHPALLFGQTCWGPMGKGLASQVQLLGQPDYSGVPGCDGADYASAIVMRRDDPMAPAEDVAPDPAGWPVLPLDRLAGRIFAYNAPDSMSGFLAISADLAAIGSGIDCFAGRIETGGHRLSVRAVAAGSADVAAIDAFSWQLALAHEPVARNLVVAGWTARRKGLPYIASRWLDADLAGRITRILADGLPL